MAVRIRLKKLGRRHRPYYRICAMDSRTPRDGKPIEELGTYDPLVRETDKRCTMKADRIDYWLGVGALPTEKVKILIDKYKGKVPEKRIDEQRKTAVPAAEPILYTPKKAEPVAEAVADEPAAESAESAESAEVESNAESEATEAAEGT